MYCLRKLKSFDVNANILNTFYSSMINSVLTFGLTSWGGNISKIDKNRLDKLIKKASCTIGKPQENIDTLYNTSLTKKTHKILIDQSHPLHNDFVKSKSQRSGRFKLPKIKTNRFRHSFFPQALKRYNVALNRN